MGTNLSLDLGSLVNYVAGEILECKITLKATEDGTYYLIGALYTANLEYISGSLFGALKVAGEAYAINSTVETSTWDLEEDDEEEQDCKFTLNRTNTILGLFLYRLENEVPSFDDDTLVDSITVSLVGTAVEAPGGFDISALMMMMVVVGMMGMMMKQVSGK